MTEKEIEKIKQSFDYLNTPEFISKMASRPEKPESPRPYEFKTGLIKWYSEKFPYPVKIEERAKMDDEGVYLIASNDFKRFKIGRTTNIYQRLKNLRGASGENIHLVLHIELQPEYDEKSHIIERLLHEYFKPKRGIGEWFNLSLRDIVEIQCLFWEHIEGEDIEDNTREFWELYKKNET